MKSIKIKADGTFVLGNYRKSSGALPQHPAY